MQNQDQSAVLACMYVVYRSIPNDIAEVNERCEESQYGASLKEGENSKRPNQCPLVVYDFERQVEILSHYGSQDDANHKCPIDTIVLLALHSLYMMTFALSDLVLELPSQIRRRDPILEGEAPTCNDVATVVRNDD